SIPGIVKNISGTENAKLDKNINDLFLRVNIGDSVKFPENNVEKAGNFIAVNNKRTSAINSAEEACRKIFIRLEACNKNTEEFLFGQLQSWVENAFVLAVKENIDALGKMPDFKFIRENKTGIISLSGLQEESIVEWHGKTIDLAFNEVLDQKYKSIPGKEIKVVSLNEISLIKGDKVNGFEGGFVLGKLFYRAFLRGGVQGGVWVMDSIQKTIEDKKNLLELFSRWKEY
ncbi:MAG: hypothetical protein KAH95_04670, partial [Spirochaetales bacterium]|nr:hypothetical protein [Spirochaetales bacterium]